MIARIAASFALITATASGALAQEPPRIAGRAIEVGLSAATVTVEGTTRASVALRGGPYFDVGEGLLGLELDLAYAHEASLDQFGVEAGASWQWAWKGGPLHPFVSVGGGLRQEKIGDFEQSRHPVGFGLGIKALASPRAGVRAEYRWRRLLDDPVEDSVEHQTSIGIALYFGNAP